MLRKANTEISEARVDSKINSYRLGTLKSARNFRELPSRDSSLFFRDEELSIPILDYICAERGNTDMCIYLDNRLLCMSMTQ